MAQFFYWLDRGDFAITLQHAWIWATLVACAAAANVAAIAAIRRRYDGGSRRA